MILKIDLLTKDEKSLLCEMISRSRDDELIDVCPEYLGAYRKDAVQKAVTQQEPNLNETGLELLKSILGKIEGVS